jgi:3-oxoacyl-[acyl-carrier-protein] synthase-3
LINPKSKIIATGSYTPDKIYTNEYFEKIVDTSDEWIRTRTGMKERHIIGEGQNTSDLSAQAARNALDEANLSPQDVDMILVATVSGDVGFPATACFVQEKLGAYNAIAFDISAACSGFIYGLDLADAYISSGRAKYVLVIGAEALSRITDYSDRNTCVLFGDGAGAAVLAPAEDDHGILATLLQTDGRLNHLLYVPGLGTKNPPSHESVDQGLHTIRMEGREVFKHAVKAMGDAAVQVIKKAEWSGKDVDWLIPHQANLRIIDATAKRANVAQERVFINIHKYGNTSAASIPIALDEARKQGKIKDGHNVVFVAFGAGFTWAAAAIKM